MITTHSTRIKSRVEDDSHYRLVVPQVISCDIVSGLIKSDSSDDSLS
jgi:hypothetical protein